MALREKLIERVQPLLPGEQVDQVFLAQTGGNPWLVNMFGLLGQSFVKRYIVAVTDKSVVVLTATFNGTKATGIHGRLPRQTRLGPHKGLWGSVTLDGQKFYVHSRFRKDIEAADAALGAAA